ncbi:hypothetical protein GRX01_01935 [Halobaculum sp. WSA2]|uniref:Uncharacterized protein n=1 Tax=Halobaculum saliterrae TaxID=2073113 RepID=A0A6B0T0I0_9EURY|nr:hypothetical protein [Halobaculum saliterrae]MXR40119.1 hypothetical protein [Halobaculum saliterrae]
MVTVIDFIVRLVTSVIDLIVIFVTDVALRDPLSFVSFLFGAAFVGGASAFLGYLALGALGYEFGIGNLPAKSRQVRGRR